MKENLTCDHTLFFRSTQGKKAHFGRKTEYLADQRIVVYSTWGARKRLWGLLPDKVFPATREMLAVPDEITTIEELHRYVKQHRRRWL